MNKGICLVILAKVLRSHITFLSCRLHQTHFYYFFNMLTGWQGPQRHTASHCLVLSMNCSNYYTKFSLLTDDLIENFHPNCWGFFLSSADTPQIGNWGPKALFLLFLFPLKTSSFKFYVHSEVVAKKETSLLKFFPYLTVTRSWTNLSNLLDITS